MALEYYENWINAHKARRQRSSSNVDVPEVEKVSNKPRIMNRPEKLRKQTERIQQEVLSRGQEYMNAFGNQNDEYRIAELEVVTRDPNAKSRYDTDAATRALLSKLNKTPNEKFMTEQITGSSSLDVDEIGHEMMVRFTKELGLKPFQAAALAGNANYETGNFKYMDEIEPEVKGSKGGINIFQYTGLKPGLRRYNFEKYAKEKGLSTTDFKTGIDFSIYELTEGDQKRVLKQLRQASTPKEANRIVVEQYLRPNREKANMTAREALTLEYAGAYRNPEAFE